MNTLWLIIGVFFIALVCYAFGIYTGWKTYENDYDNGWVDALDWAKEQYEMVPIDDMLRELYQEEEKRNKRAIAQDIIKELDDVFGEEDEDDDDDNIIDCGEY